MDTQTDMIFGSMHTSFNTVRTVVTNRANFVVMQDRTGMGKPLVAAVASRGTGNGAQRRTRGRPWRRV